MPSLNFQIGPQGPIVELFVGVSSARRKALQAAGAAVPQLELVRLLLDTGASNTNICSSVIAKFGIQPTGQVPVHTPSTGSTPAQMGVFDLDLFFTFPGNTTPVHHLDTVPVLAADFQAAGIGGLLGRDILAKANVIYHGDMKLCTLNF